MEKILKECAHTHEGKLWFLLDEVYGNAQWALRYGATKEDLIDQIEQALELHQECLREDGWLIGPDTGARAAHSPAKIAREIQKTDIVPSE